MVAQEKVEEEVKPEEPPADEPPPISTNLVGNGPGMAGLGAYKPGQGNGTGGVGGRGGGSKYGYFASQAQKSIAEAMRSHPRVRTASFTLTARIWADASGRVTRATLAGSTGDSALDAALKAEVLSGLLLPDPPPAGMPMPIVMRLNARKSASLTTAGR
jgi:hypothetical protein